MRIYLCAFILWFVWNDGFSQEKNNVTHDQEGLMPTANKPLDHASEMKIKRIQVVAIPVDSNNDDLNPSFSAQPLESTGDGNSLPSGRTLQAPYILKATTKRLNDGDRLEDTKRKRHQSLNGKINRIRVELIPL